MNKRAKALVLTTLAIVTTISIIVFYNYLSHKGKDKYTITVLPTYAKITIDGKSVRNQSNIYLSPGPHQYLATARNFETLKQTIDVPNNQDYIDISLRSINEEGDSWRLTHQRLYNDMQARAATKLQKKGLELKSAYPISSMLPYENAADGYAIGYTTPDGTPKSFIITIHGQSSLSRRLAITQIKKWGYNPANYNISFRDYTNPLQTIRND